MSEYTSDVYVYTSVYIHIFNYISVCIDIGLYIYICLYTPLYFIFIALFDTDKEKRK